MQVTSTQLNIKTKRDNSGELSRFFVLFVLLFFVTSCTTTNQLNNSSSPLEVKTGDSTTGTGFISPSSSNELSYWLAGLIAYVFWYGPAQRK